MMRAPIKDLIVKAPDIVGPHGKAWRCDLAELLRTQNVKADDNAGLVQWIAEAPWAHPIWHSYMLTLMHLRPMPDNRPTQFYLEGATHEMWLYALDPEGKREPVILGAPLGRDTCQPLTPMNFAAQFIAEDDEAAAIRIHDAVRRICEGKLSPDTDFIRHWMHLFGDNMIKDKARAGETRLVMGIGTPAATEIVIPAKPGPQDMH
jgi:hypothetical protein